MRLQQSTLHITLAASLLVMCVPAAAAQSAGACAEHPHCTEVPSFVAAVTDFRESTAGGYQVLSMTMRFRNKTARPLVLAYVSGSGLGTDDQGNRYPAAPGSLRGLGEVTPHAFDPKFVLQPGESGDARLEFNWQRGNQIRGTRYVLDLAVRELEPVAGNQWRLGREHALQFAGLGGPSAPLAGVPSGPAAPPAQPASGNPPPAAAADACEGRPRCRAEGRFMTEVTRLTESKEGGWQVLTFTVRFRNLSDQELVLAHTDRSAVAVDDLGNRYGSINNDYVKGMGISRYGRLDPSFRLRPSEARDATFRLHFRPGRQVVGTRYTFDFAVEEIEVLPRDQYRSTRQFALGFPDLTPGTDSLEEAVRQALPTCGFPGCPFGDRVRRNHRELRGRACRSAVAQCRHGRVAAAGALQADSPGRK